MKIVKIEQRSPGWHIWRKSGIGSSDIAAIVGKSPYKTPYQVWETLMGLRESDQINPMMQRGIDYEDEARKYLGDSSLRPECIEHDHYDYFHASLDGLGNGYFVEIKVPSKKNYDSYENKVPEHYKLQVQWQLLVSGLPSCTFLAYSPELRGAHIHQIRRDEEVIEELERAGDRFWSDYQKGIAPPLSKNDVRELHGKDVQFWCEKYRDWSEKKSEAEEGCSTARENILRYGDGSSFRAYGVHAVKMVPRSSYDIEAMKRDGIDVERYKKTSGKESFMLRVVQ